MKSLVLGWQTGAFANNGLVLFTTGTATADAAYASPRMVPWLTARSSM